MRIWAHLQDALDRHGRAAMVTVVATRGSAPREAGARLIVHPDGAFTGTIGGGTLEWRAIALAQMALSNASAKAAETRRFALGPELGQCCGGQVELIVELIDRTEREMVDALAAREAAGPFATRAAVSPDRGVRREIVEDMTVRPGRAEWHDRVLIEGFGDDPRRLLLFGAGHVGRALVLALAPLPFSVTWIDSRAEAFPTRVPGNVSMQRLDDPTTALDGAAEGSFVLVMTHSHQLDLALVGAALADDRFPYVGLIGSASKRARFERRLAEAGIAPARIDALICPIGVGGINAKAPAVIAAATAAELLIRDEELHGADAKPERRDPHGKRTGVAARINQRKPVA